MPRAGPRVALHARSGSSARGRTTASRRAIDIEGFAGVRHERAARPRHPDRSDVAVLVRAAPTRCSADPPVRRLHPRPQPRGDASERRARGRSVRRPPLRSRGERQRRRGILSPDGEVPERRSGSTRSCASGSRFRAAGATARVQYVVTDMPDGEVRLLVLLGRRRRQLLEAALGEDPDVEVTMTLSYADAALVQEGSLDPNAAFMQGRMKVAGTWRS